MARDKKDEFHVADGFDFAPDDEDKTTPVAGEKKPQNKETISATQNPYYTYHPKVGNRGGTIGAPRKTVKKIQISIGCTPEEKEMYQQAAAKDNRNLPDFVNTAIKEYIATHNLT